MRIHHEPLADVTRYLESFRNLRLEDKEGHFRSYLRALEPYKRIGAGTRILEVGAGIGWFPLLCQRKGLTCKALEISPRLIEYARELGRRYGLEPDIELGNIEESDIGSELYDVETGSLVTTPVPVRFAEIDGSGRMAISTRRVESIPSLRAAGIGLQQHALEVAREGVVSVAVATMRGLGVPQRDAAALAPQIADAFVAHLQGDEHFAGGRKLGVRELSFMGRLAVGSRARLVDELWNDLPPDDNDVTLDLNGGAR